MRRCCAFRSCPLTNLTALGASGVDAGVESVMVALGASGVVCCAEDDVARKHTSGTANNYLHSVCTLANTLIPVQYEAWRCRRVCQVAKINTLETET